MLHQAGVFGIEEHAMLAFQPELNPSYDLVGAPYVRRPDGNQGRDALAEWETILNTQEGFEVSAVFVEKTRNVVNVLRQLAALRPDAA